MRSIKIASVYERTVPFADGTFATEFVIELAGGGWLDYRGLKTHQLNHARSFPTRDLAEGVAEREGFTVVNKG